MCFVYLLGMYHLSFLQVHPSKYYVAAPYTHALCNCTSTAYCVSDLKVLLLLSENFNANAYYITNRTQILTLALIYSDDVA